VKVNNIEQHNRFWKRYTENDTTMEKKRNKKDTTFLRTQALQIDIIAAQGFKWHELNKIIYTGKHQQ